MGGWMGERMGECMAYELGIWFRLEMNGRADELLAYVASIIVRQVWIDATLQCTTDRTPLIEDIDRGVIRQCPQLLICQLRWGWGSDGWALKAE